MTDKKSARRTAKAARSSLIPAQAAALSRTLCANFIKHTAIPKGTHVMTYMPLACEPDITAVNMFLLKSGCRVFVPSIAGGKIKAARLTSNTPMKTGAYGIKVPSDAAVLKDTSLLSLVIVPGLAFDLNGNRAGFGKGYYDRFLGEISCLRAALCFEFQVFAAFSPEPHDVPVDVIITEKRIIYRR